MLTQLYIRNYGLFEEERIQFGPGLNILTGETGAGKSLLVGAVGMIMGKRADSSAVFLSEDKCIVEGTFEQLSGPVLQQLHTYQDNFDLEGDGVTLRRELRANGKSRSFINDTPVSLNLMKEVASFLLDLHGQHENQSLLRIEKQLELLDMYAGCEAQVTAFGGAWKEIQRLQKEIQELEAKEQILKQQFDYLKFQLEELEAAQLAAGEEDRLTQELQLLQNAETIRETLGLATEKLYNEEVSIYSQLSEVLTSLEKIGNLQSVLNNEVTRIKGLCDSVQESSFTLQNLLDQVESDQERLQFAEERLGVYHSLKLKYAVGSGEELIEKYQELKGNLDDYDSLGSEIQVKRDQLNSQMDVLGELGLAIEKTRLRTIPVLADQVQSILQEVGMPKAEFSIKVERLYHPEGPLECEGEMVRPGSRGINRVDFMIRPNPGTPEGPLSQIASGGEISRVMLALKTALATRADFPVLIFDEIDTGISGEVAKRVGELMNQLGNKFQLLSITHLPQIAARGKQHLKIVKKSREGQTLSQVEQLSEEARVQELAMMLSGESPSASAIANARELLKNS